MKFWNYDDGGALRIDGPIDTECWFDDEVTPKLFREELQKHPGALTVYINSPGGDVFAASEIYSMLMEHEGAVTVKIDALAASAASVIAMAGTTVLLAPTAYLMIHDPLTCVMGNKNDFKEAIKILEEIKEGIINAYEIKTKLPRDKISAMMDGDGTWLSAYAAMELGFADGLIGDDKQGDKPLAAAAAKMGVRVYNNAAYARALVERICASAAPAPDPEPTPEEVALRAKLTALARGSF